MGTMLALIGLMTVLAMAFMVVVMLLELARAAIEHKRIRNIQKHRFDKPPTAKCYCIDCVLHSDDGYCGKFDGWCTADNWFCWAAEPSSTDKGD